MTSHTSLTAFSNEGEPFDLITIFIGREQQLDLFKLYLDRWKQLMANASPIEPSVTTSPSPNNKIQGLIVLLYGRGGFGKSTLLKHYRDIVLADNQKFIVGEIVDWEFAIEGRRSVFNPVLGQEIDAAEYFRLLCSKLAVALNKHADDFKEYQAAVKAVEEAKKQANAVLDSVQKGEERYASLRVLAGPGAVTLLRWIAPRVGQVLDSAKVTEKVEEVIGQGAQIGAEQLVHVYTQLHDKLGHKLDDYLEPALRLGLALGRDLARFAKNFPLLIFFDTYEEIDEGDTLLRLVMGAAGVRVGWVLAGRDNLWAGLEQRKRSLGKVYGYKEIVPARLGLAIDFNVGGVGAFTTSDIVEYFTLLHEMLPTQLAPPAVTEEDAERIWNVTQGVPLAVRIAASLYRERVDLALITEKADGKREIVDEMVQRYLLHARDDQDERMRLYGLAMLGRADHPAAIAAALSLTPEQARMSYASELSRLHRRYSFIFTEKDEPSLHQEVRTFLRLWLLERYQQPEIQAINERLKVAHEATLKRLEEQRNDPTLRARFEDERWVETYIDLAEQAFWLDPAEGVRYALPFMIVANRYRRFASNEMIGIGEFFHTKIQSPYVDWWKLATENLRSVDHGDDWWKLAIENLRSVDYGDLRKLVTAKLKSVNPSFLREKSHQLEKLARVIHQQNIGFPLPLTDHRDEVEALLWWRLGELEEQKAWEWYEKALTRLGLETALRKAAARTYWNVAHKLRKEKKVDECLPLLNRALELTPDDAAAYTSRGAVYRDLREYARALEDYAHAIELDPNAVYPYRGRGAVYYDLREYQQALEDYTHAIELDPSNAYSYAGRGMTYLHLKNAVRAQADLSLACGRDPRNIKTQWRTEWAGWGRQRIGVEIADRLEKIATIDAQQYHAYVCRAVALGLRGKLKEGLEEVEKAITSLPEEWDAYFWKGMLCAYYYQKGDQMAIATVEVSLERGLPPLLLVPLYWLEKDSPSFFEKYVIPLLKKYDA